MRLYVTDVQLKIIAEWLLRKDVACCVVHEALQLGKLACEKCSWGCVLCPIYRPNDPAWLLKAWNAEMHHLVQAATIHADKTQCLLACPEWALQDPYVRTITRKLSGVQSAPSLIDWDKCDGLVPAIAQDAKTHEVLMQAYMDEIAWQETLQSGCAVYFSRSRRKLWCKGEESGNTQIIREIRIDCDADSIVLKVEQVGGAACHMGYVSCFFRKIEADGSVTIVCDRVFDPKVVYEERGAV